MTEPQVLALSSQDDVSAEIASIRDDYEQDGAEETQPLLHYPPHRSSLLRHPTKDLQHADPELIESSSPQSSDTMRWAVRSRTSPSSTQVNPWGDRRSGRVVDGEGRPARHQLVEVWHTNAAGRYLYSETSTLNRSTLTSPAWGGC